MIRQAPAPYADGRGGMASLYWWKLRKRWVVGYKDPKTGKRKSKTFTDRGRAHEIKLAIENIPLSALDNPTLRDQAIMYTQAKNLHRRTALDYGRNLKQSCGAFLSKPADQVNKRDLLTMRQNLNHLSPKTVNNAQAAISAILQWASSMRSSIAICGPGPIG